MNKKVLDKSVDSSDSLLNQDTLLVIIIYSLSYGMMLFNQGIFWDDWCFYGQDKVFINSFMIRLFGPMYGSLLGTSIYYLQSLPHVMLITRTIVFLSFLFSALLVNSILKNIKELDSLSRFFIVVFFAVFPVNTVKIGLVNLHYGIQYLMFFIGFWLITNYVLNKSKIIARIVAIFAFYMSFFVGSFLVFYSLLIIYIVYWEKKNLASIKSIIQYILKYLDLLLLPVVFWIIKVSYFTPFGLFKNYNRVTLDGIVYGFKWSFLGFYTSLIEVVLLSFEHLSFISIILAVLLSGILLKKKFGDRDSAEHIKYLFVFGIFAFFIAVFPYFVVYRLPRINNLESRHQMLVPLGASFIIYFGFKFLFDKLNIKKPIQIFLISVAVCLMVETNFKNCLEYQADWYKQLSLIENVKDNEIVKKHQIFLFQDNTLELNAKQRTYRFFEYTGMMKYVFGDETRFGENYNNFNGFESYREYFALMSNSLQYNKKQPEYLVVIDYGDYKLDYLKVLRFMFRECFTKKEFKEHINKITKLTCIPIEH